MRERASDVMLLYAQVPLALLSNPRVRDLPPSAELTLFRLYLHAALCSTTRDVIPLPRGVAYAHAVRSLVGEHIDRMDALVSAGLVVYEADALRLTLTTATPLSAPPSRVEAPAEAPAHTGKPSDSPAAERARNDRKKFKRRLSPFAHVAEGVVWETWIATSDGAAFVSERESEFRGYRERAVPAAVPNAGTAPRYRPGTAPVPPQGTALPSHTLPSEKKKEERGEEGAQGTAVPPQSTAAGTAQGTAPQDPDPAEVLARMRKASGGIVADGIGAGATELVAVKRALGVMLGRGATLDGIIASTKHLTHGHWTQKAKRSAVTAGRLVEEREGRASILGELLAESRVCERCNPPRDQLATPPPVHLPGFKPTARGL
jgi:hypothetical protein